MSFARSLCFSLALVGMGCGGSPATPDSGSAVDGGHDASVGPVCGADSDCSDGVYCTGDERCMPGSADANARGCVAGTPPCDSATELCVEDLTSCQPQSCENPDQDGDGHRAITCGGDDCDDSDGNTYRGNAEVCDDGHDEDCDPTTLGGIDDDGDEFVSAACCNGTTCGDDCDDSRRDVFPGATEACNTIDDDCDDTTDGSEAFCPTGACIASRCRASSWDMTFGITGPDDLYGIDTDGVGNIYLYMYHGGTSPVYEVVSLTAAGANRWSVPIDFGGTGLAAAPDGNSVIVGGISTGVLSLQWLDAADGAPTHSQSVTVPSGWTQFEQSAAIGATNHAHVSASREWFTVAATLVHQDGTGTVDDRAIFVTKIGWDGTELDQQILDAPDSDQVLVAMSSNQAGDVILAGTTAGDVTFGGTSIQAGSCLIRLDSELTPDWASTIFAGPIGVAVSELREMLVAGYFEAAVDQPWGEHWGHDSADGRDAFAVSLGPDGSHRWTFLRPGPANESFGFTAFDGRGGAIVTGSFVGTFDAGRGPWTATGNCNAFYAIWDVVDRTRVVDARRFASTNCAGIRDVVEDPFGATVIAGLYKGTITLLTGSYASRDVSLSPSDIYLVRVSD